jgi:hypothetical protein
MVSYIVIDNITQEVIGWGHVKEEAFSLLPPAGITRLEIEDPRQYQHKYYYDGANLVPYTVQELNWKRNPPEGFAWKAPERILQDIRTLDQAKDIKLAQMKKKHSNELDKGFSSNSKNFLVNRTDIPMYAQEAMQAKIDNIAWNIDWELKNGNITTLTRNEMIQLNKDQNDFIKGLKATFRSVKQSIEACTTVAQVDAIVWP